MSQGTERITTPKFVEMLNSFFKSALLVGGEKRQETERNMMYLKEMKVLGKMSLAKNRRGFPRV